MLIIKNIDRAVGMECDGHVIESVGEVLVAGTPSYAFRFSNIPYAQNNSFGPIVEVILYKTPLSDGTYQLFAMGWHRVTYINIDEHRLKRPYRIAFNIEVVLKKLKTYLLSIQ